MENGLTYISLSPLLIEGGSTNISVYLYTPRRRVNLYISLSPILNLFFSLSPILLEGGLTYISDYLL